jgi:hypothetical protein
MRVRAKGWYVFAPCLLDKIDRRYSDIIPGELVQVRNLPSAPPCNTMGQAHVFNRNGDFCGMVATASLTTYDGRIA